MEYEPQTMDSHDMNERIELFENEFFTLAGAMSIISTNTETILEELDKRLERLVSHIDTDTPKTSVN